MKQKIGTILYIILFLTYFPLFIVGIIVLAHWLTPNQFYFAILGTALALVLLLNKTLFPSKSKE
ncbi:hypothetical protein LCGC14_0422340 [marine sediment metagenome]|uniref:Uncharacterized protein n=1 Tax=marine sediment metagenome TaxID=412755 RepID=A0A0F9SWS4_9ZZZZ